MNIHKRRFHSLILVASGVLGAWLNPGGAQTPSFTISGRVVEADRLNPIGGATVHLSGRPLFFTDSNGEFRLESHSTQWLTRP